MVQTGAQLGPYRLLRRIGSGGMAEVFLAERGGAQGFSRTVALKTIIAVGAEDEGIGLFLDEARVAGYLEHPAIVQTVDLGFENDTLFIVMEYVPGPALSRIIRDLKKAGRSMPPHMVAYVGARVASALDYAHRRATTPEGQTLQLVHRDISPQNILLTRAGMVKLTDFGVARASIQTHRTRTGQVRGKAAYMAPEQVRAGALDGRTDIFGLGLVLYEALTGVRAYQRKTDIMSMRAILTDEVAPIEQANPGAPPDLVAVIKKALRKKPDERFSSAQALAEALQETYRAHSEAVIETEISALINELFGPEQFSTEEDPMPVEAWQPTITKDAGGEGASLVPYRLAGAKLSPKIAAMLAGHGGTPASLETPAEAWDGGERAPSGQTPGRNDASAGRFAETRASAESTPLLGGRGTGVTPPATGTSAAVGRDGATLPGAPVMGQTRARSMLPNGSLAADPMAFFELLPGSQIGSPGSRPGDTGTGLGPSVSSIAGTPPGSIGSLQATDSSATSRLPRALVWALVALCGALVAALATVIWSRSNEARPQLTPIRASASAHASDPLQSEAERDTVGVARITDDPAAGAIPEAPTRIEPGPSNARERPLKGRLGSTKHTDPARRLENGIGEAAPAAVRADAPQGGDQAKKTERDAFIRRAIEAKRKAEADPTVAKELTRLVLDLTAIKDYEIKPEDRELVRRAEGK